MKLTLWERIWNQKMVCNSGWAINDQEDAPYKISAVLKQNDVVDEFDGIYQALEADALGYKTINTYKE